MIKTQNIKIETERLLLRQAVEEDKFDIFKIVSDKETCYDDGGYEPFKEMDEKFYKCLMALVRNKDQLVVELKEKHKVIGILHIMKEEERAVPECSIGYIIEKDFRRKGYGYEAVSALISYCFSTLNNEMITASVFDKNKASMCLLEKLGFIKEGITHKAINHPAYGIIDKINYYKEK